MNKDKAIAMTFLEEHKEEIRRLVEEDHYTYFELKEKFKNDIYIEDWWIGIFCRDNRISSIKNRSIRKLGDANPAKKSETKIKISNSVKEKWVSGDYDLRVNGMIGKSYLKHPNFKMINWYKEKHDFYSEDNTCECCGKDLSNEKSNIHHIDEDHSNILLTNLQRLCVPCHQRFHLSRYKQPFVSVRISHELQYGHRLPDYNGKCYFDHGHRGIITITVRRRIDPKTGFAVDFNELKKIIKERIDDVLDHEYLNNYLPNPTTENTLIWLWNQLSPVLKGIQSIGFAEGSKTEAVITQKDMLEAVLRGQYEADWIPEEYRSNVDDEITLSEPSSDHLKDAYSINTDTSKNMDFKWYYDMIMFLNSPEIKDELKNLGREVQ